MKSKGFLIIFFTVTIIAGGLAVTATMVDFIKYPTSNNSYKNEIDSLAKLVESNNQKFRVIDSFSNLEHQRTKRLESQLSDLNYKTNKNLKRYEEELDRLNRLTDSQLVIKFTDIFDYD